MAKNDRLVAALVDSITRALGMQVLCLFVQRSDGETMVVCPPETAHDVFAVLSLIDFQAEWAKVTLMEDRGN